MLAHHAVRSISTKLGVTAHFIALHGVRYGAGGIRLVQSDRKFQAIFLDESLEHRRAEGIVVLEGRMHADHRDIARRKRFVDSPRLGHARRDGVWAQHLKGRQHDDPAAQTAER